MKKYLLILLAFVSIQSFGKKVKFSVDMSPVYLTGDSVHAAGIHVYGNFQGAAGYPYDWDPGTTSLTRETADTMIYSIVVDIPAFLTYEYRFINGDQSYEVEFVPMESRANGNFDDNRWLFVDSLANDTSFVGVLPFSGNAPDGLTLLRFRVNMNNETVHPDGVHIGGSFQGWNPASTRMGVVLDLSGIYEYSAYVLPGNYEFRYVNGNTSGDYEYVWGDCATNGERTVTVTQDIILDPVNFGSCLVGISEYESANIFSVFPNPMENVVKIEFKDQSSSHTVSVNDIAGRLIAKYSHVTGNSFVIDRAGMQSGVYFISITGINGLTSSAKLMVR